MRKAIRPFLLLLALWFVGDRALAFAMGALLDYSRDPIAALYGGRAGADIVVLGNSRAYRNLDTGVLTQRFGGRVTTLALPGTSMELSRALFEDYVDRYGAPRMLVVELSALFSNAESLKEVRAYASRSTRLSALLREHYPTLYYAGAVSHLFNYNNTSALNAAHKVFYPMPDLMLDGSMRPDIDIVQGRYFAPLQENVAAAEQIVSLAKRCHIETRLVLSPVLPAYAAANQIGALRAEAKGIAGGFRVWDAADDPPTGVEMFTDPTHLNREGVRAFMELLARQDFFATGDARQDPRQPCKTG